MCIFAEKINIMKFIVSSQLLSKNLQNVNGITTVNRSVPIIENILFIIADNQLTLRGTDLETTISATLELSEVEGEGSIVVPGKLIVETIKSLPDVPVVFNIKEDYTIEISANNGKYELMGFDAEQYPQFKEIEEEKSFKIAAATLENAIGKTAFATGNAEIRPVMGGVFCQISNENITLVATDAHRLVRYINTSVKANVEADLIIPKKPLLQLKNILQGLDVDVNVSYSEDRACFAVENTVIATKLIEGKYPNYEAVIPSNNTNVLQVERLDLLQKMKNISLYANQSTHQIRFKIEGDKLILTAEDLDHSTKATASVSCVFESEESEFEIGFSSKLLQEILINLDANNAIFKFSHSTGAVLVFEDEKKDDEDILMLIMPVMLNA
jgi:DNA polymerase-3 subunit beta